MKRSLLGLVLLCFFFQVKAEKTVRCLIETAMGKIRIELYPEKAPLTVANFLKYVDTKLYDGTTFFRVCTPENEKDRKVKIEVVQGGEVAESRQFKPVMMETTAQTGIKHTNGAISMARDEPNSATSSFFICINDQPELDFAGERNPDGQGFAAFGHVTGGMDVVRKIQALKESGQYLVEPVKIKTIRRL